MDVYAGAAISEPKDGYATTKAAAWWVFILSFLLMLFDFIDRQIVVSMLPIIKAEWQLSDTQLGGLLSIVAIIVAILSIPTAIIADRWSRVRCVFLMAFVWSVATIACSFAGSYGQLLALRAAVGAGEAGYNAVGSAILASLFPTRIRAVILSAFSAAAAFGAVIGVILGGILAKHYGWHAAFGIVGIPGLIVAILYLFADDYKTVKVGSEASLAGVWTMARELYRRPSAAAIYVASGLQLFVVSSIFSWLSSFFNRIYHLPVDQAGIRAASLLLAGSVAGIVWGHIADRFGRKRSRNKIWVMATSSLLSAIILPIAFGVVAPGPAQFVLILAGCIFVTGAMGPVGAVAIDVVHPGVRATAIAVGVLIQNTLGLAAGPFVTGLISDRYGLATTLSIIPLAGAAAAIVFLLILRRYDKDLAAARSEAAAVG
jgi:MFS family permease